MATARPTVTVIDALTGKKTDRTIARPAVFDAPIRSDIVNIVHRDINKNHRQANGIGRRVGHLTSAESWGTGRAVSRIPRVSGGGTHRSGQAAFGNMTRGGHMYSPKTTYRRIHRRVNQNLRRYAIVSAIAASGIPALVMARGHKVQDVAEVPVVLDHASLATIKKTKDAVAVLKRIGAYADVERVIASHKMRAGKGKLRNRRHTQRCGPLVVYNDNKSGLTRAFRNIPGVDLCKVTRLNILKLAPGSHVGRFIIWTSDAFEALDKIYGTYAEAKPVQGKRSFVLPYAKMTVTDIPRILHAEAVKRAMKAKGHAKRQYTWRNPLVNFRRLVKLNPAAANQRRVDIIRQLRAKGQYKLADSKKKRATKQPRLAERKVALKLHKLHLKQHKALVKSLFA